MPHRETTISRMSGGAPFELKVMAEDVASDAE